MTVSYLVRQEYLMENREVTNHVGRTDSKHTFAFVKSENKVISDFLSMQLLLECRIWIPM